MKKQLFMTVALCLFGLIT